MCVYMCTCIHRCSYRYVVPSFDVPLNSSVTRCFTSVTWTSPPSPPGTSIGSAMDSATSIARCCVATVLNHNGNRCISQVLTIEH